MSEGFQLTLDMALRDAEKRAWDALPPVDRLREILRQIPSGTVGIMVDIKLLRDILAVLEKTSFKREEQQ